VEYGSYNLVLEYQQIPDNHRHHVDQFSSSGALLAACPGALLLSQLEQRFSSRPAADPFPQLQRFVQHKQTKK
jgi:hypothetical protein